MIPLSLLGKLGKEVGEIAVRRWCHKHGESDSDMISLIISCRTDRYQKLLTTCFVRSLSKVLPTSALQLSRGTSWARGRKDSRLEVDQPAIHDFLVPYFSRGNVFVDDINFASSWLKISWYTQAMPMVNFPTTKTTNIPLPPPTPTPEKWPVWDMFWHHLCNIFLQEQYLLGLAVGSLEMVQGSLKLETQSTTIHLTV